MATDYKIVVVPDTGGTRPCIECPQCLGLQLLHVLRVPYSCSYTLAVVPSAVVDPEVLEGGFQVEVIAQEVPHEVCKKFGAIPTSSAKK